MRRIFLSSLFAALVALNCLQSLATSSETFDESAAWPDDDWTTENVNEGTLELLAVPPLEAVHHHHNEITVSRASLREGWVLLRQCHRNIDRVSRAQILFRATGIRGLRITEAINIGNSQVENASVQLEDVGADSLLCLEAESRALRIEGNGVYRIENGPFMRRFLDGYYPMRVTQKIDLSDSGLRFESIIPVPQPGFEVRVTDNGIEFDTWFEGRLKTEIDFIGLD